MIDDITIYSHLVSKVADAIIGPTGGMMAVCLISGAYGGWRFSEKVLVKKYVAEVQKLEEFIRQNELKCRDEIMANKSEIYELRKRLQLLEDIRADILTKMNNKS